VTAHRTSHILLGDIFMFSNWACQPNIQAKEAKDAEESRSVCLLLCASGWPVSNGLDMKPEIR